LKEEEKEEAKKIERITQIHLLSNSIPDENLKKIDNKA
jgi:hypothetical protein